MDAKPFYSKAYAVPYAHLKVFKEELNPLVAIGVLSHTGASDWAAGTFTIPKKDNRVRWISDFRALNKAIRRKKYPLPRIQDILNRSSGYKFFTKHSFVLDDKSSDLCTINTPFGMFKCNRLPMGVCQSPDIAQEIMEAVLQGLAEVEIYIDDIGIFLNSWEEHQASVRTVLD